MHNYNISTVHISGSLRRILTQLNQPSSNLSPSLASLSLFPCVLTLSPLFFKCLLMIPWIWFVYCCSLSDSSLPKHWTCLEPEPSESKLAVRHTHYLWLSCQLVISHSSLKLMMPKTNVVNLPVTQLCFLCSHLFLISLSDFSLRGKPASVLWAVLLRGLCGEELREEPRPQPNIVGSLVPSEPWNGYRLMKDPELEPELGAKQPQTPDHLRNYEIINAWW